MAFPRRARDLDYLHSRKNSDTFHKVYGRNNSALFFAFFFKIFKEITTDEGAELIGFLKSNLNLDGMDLYAGMQYRHCLVAHNGAVESSPLKSSFAAAFALP